jgi:CheY-like chemotaxis protein
MSKQADAAAKPGQILVIDDEEGAVRVLTQILEQAGYEVTSTQSGKQGVSLQRGNPSDLIIMDIFMPDLNGVEAIQRLKKSYPKTPIIAISGGQTMAGRDCLELAREKGADYTFRKPFKMAEFVETVRTALTSS